MPELPEVETTAAELRERLVGRLIECAEIAWDRSIGYPTAGEFVRRMYGRTVAGVSRRAKYVVMEIDGEERLIVHMRMTGHLLLEPAAALRPRFERATFVLDHGEELRFADQRKFGRLYLVTAAEFAAG